MLAILTSTSNIRAISFLTSRSDVRATKDLRGGRHTPSMKEDWLYRTSFDKKNHGITHMMMTIGDPYLVMMTPRDPDRVMIQIQQ